MDYLWTPWRYAYVSATEKTAGCVFCEAPKVNDDAKTHIVHRGEHCFVILNAYPYTPGHVMVVPYAHLDELQKLPRKRRNEMMALSQRMETVLRELYHPDGINLGDEYWQGRRGGDRGTYSHARAAALGGGREFRFGGRRDAGSAGDAGCDLGEGCGRRWVDRDKCFQLATSFSISFSSITATPSSLPCPASIRHRRRPRHNPSSC